jgi:hypothetical protein
MPVPPDGIGRLENSVIDGAALVVMSSNQEMLGCRSSLMVFDELFAGRSWAAQWSLGMRSPHRVLGPRLSDQPWPMVQRRLAARVLGQQRRGLVEPRALCQAGSYGGR